MTAAGGSKGGGRVAAAIIGAGDRWLCAGGAADEGCRWQGRLLWEGGSDSGLQRLQWEMGGMAGGVGLQAADGGGRSNQQRHECTCAHQLGGAAVDVAAGGEEWLAAAIEEASNAAVKKAG
ncbi:hypothetical protein BHE74_00058711 [Ensete ventricosum]|nr:hypothetical protein BHE74_00058711 [Ensete ventricosum]